MASFPSTFAQVLSVGLLAATWTTIIGRALLIDPSIEKSGAKAKVSRRRRGRVKDEDVELPELTGVAKLLSEMPVAELDLHGYTSAQARPRVRDFLTTHSRASSGSVVHIVTGKGAGSEGAPVLPGLVREMLDHEVAHMVERYAGMPGGGGWVVRVT